jgi:hypothetical protein
VRSGVFRETTYSYGSYGFAVPARNVKTLRDGFAADLRATGSMISPDVSWYEDAEL